MTDPILPYLPFSRPFISEAAIEEVADCLRSGWIATGPKTLRFEKAVQEYLGSDQVLSVSSATAGLHLSLLALGIGPGDEVIVPSMTWASTVNVVEHVGAVPVFADVDRETLLISTDAVERHITQKTKAIIPVHFAGAPADLDSLNSICISHNLTLIEDAAHAMGTRYKGELVGHSSSVAVFSLHAIKNITTGEGGLISSRLSEFSENIKLLRFHGISKDAWQRFSGSGSPHYDILIPGLKYNLSDIQSAIGIHQIKELETVIESRTRLAAIYSDAFASIPGIKPLGIPDYSHRHAWNLFPVRIIEEDLGVNRDQFMHLLKERNIGTGLHFEAIHLCKYYQEKYPQWRGKLPHTEWNAERICSLPLFTKMSEQDAFRVVASCKEISNLKKGNTR